MSKKVLFSILAIILIIPLFLFSCATTSESPNTADTKTPLEKLTDRVSVVEKKAAALDTTVKELAASESEVTQNDFEELQDELDGLKNTVNDLIELF